MRFYDRTDAGRQLADRLTRQELRNPLVLGLPRGGVVVAEEVARALHAPLDVAIARKLGAPMNPEFGVGAIAPGGVRVLDEEAVRLVGVTSAELEQITAEEQIELERRLARYRGDAPPLHLQGRTVILVDDGLATGVTARAAIRWARQQDPHAVILAVPVGAPETVAALRHEVEGLICLAAPAHFRAVGQFYDDFRQTSDEEVIAILDRARAQRRASGAAGAG